MESEPNFQDIEIYTIFGLLKTRVNTQHDTIFSVFRCTKVIKLCFRIIRSEQNYPPSHSRIFSYFGITLQSSRTFWPHVHRHLWNTCILHTLCCFENPPCPPEVHNFLKLSIYAENLILCHKQNLKKMILCFWYAAIIFVMKDCRLTTDWRHRHVGTHLLQAQCCVALS